MPCRSDAEGRAHEPPEDRFRFGTAISQCRRKFNHFVVLVRDQIPVDRPQWKSSVFFTPASEEPEVVSRRNRSSWDMSIEGTVKRDPHGDFIPVSAARPWKIRPAARAKSSTSVKITGTTTRLSTVEVSNPPMTITPIG